jgi:hypothetical protein
LTIPNLFCVKRIRVTFLLFTLGITGCDLTSNSVPIVAAALRGSVHGGQQPISAASIQLYAAGTTGYGTGATALGSPVTTASDGSFTLTGTYTCPLSSNELYLIATGGNPGLPSGTNPAIALAVALGPCNYAGSSGPTLDPSTYIVVNEATTVAAVYSLAQFWQPNSFLVGTSSTNTTGLVNAFTTAQTLVQNSTGTAYSTTPPLGSATVPQSKINTLANLLAACVNTNGTDGTCASLFAAVAPQNSTTPANTLAALLDIALSPATNVPTLYALNSSTAPFQPSLTSPPSDLSLAEIIHYPGIHYLKGLAFDSYGNAWTAGQESSSFTSPAGVLEISPAGDPLSGSAPGYSDSHLTSPGVIAVDSSNNVWATDAFTKPAGIVNFANNGTDLTPAGGIPAGGGSDQYQPNDIATTGSDVVLVNVAHGSSNNPNAPNGGIIELNPAGTIINSANEFNSGLLSNPGYLALDSANTIWLASTLGPSVYHFDFNGNSIATSPAGGGGLNYPKGMATDKNRNLWIVNYSYSGLNGTMPDSVSKFDSSGNALSPAITGYSNAPFNMPTCIAVDGDGNVWVANSLGSIVKLSPSGTNLSGNGGFTANIYVPSEMAIDSSGDVWVANNVFNSSTDSSLTKFIGIAGPAATPLGINGSYGQRP